MTHHTLTAHGFLHPTGAARSRPACYAALAVLEVSLFIASVVPGPAAQTTQAVAQKALQSVVMLSLDDANGKTAILGSGFVVRGGVIATNLHVIQGSVRGSARLVGMSDEYKVAGILALDREQDLVLLSVPGIKAPSLSLGDSSRVTVGDEVYVVGNPRGLEGTFSQGIVSAIRQVGSRTLVQVTAPLSPGSSGGPVLNSRGEVIGIAEATIKGGQNLNFAVPSSYLAPLLADMRPVRPLFAGAGRMEPSRQPPKPPQRPGPPPGESSEVESHFQRCEQLTQAGVDLANTGRPSAATEKYREAELACRLAEADGLYPSAVHRTLGTILAYQGRWEGAIAEYREAMSLRGGEDWTGHDDIGKVLAAKGDLDGAIAERRLALQLLGPVPSDAREEIRNLGNATLGELHRDLGLLLAQKQDVGGAVAEFREAVRLKPSEASGHYFLGYLLEETADFTGALRSTEPHKSLIPIIRKLARTSRA